MNCVEIEGNMQYASLSWRRLVKDVGSKPHYCGVRDVNNRRKHIGVSQLWGCTFPGSLSPKSTPMPIHTHINRYI